LRGRTDWAPWTPVYGAECAPSDDGGWLIRLPSPTSELTCSLSPQRWASRTLHVSLRGNPTSSDPRVKPYFSSAILGLGNGAGAEEKRIHGVKCGFQWQFLPSPWHLAAVCGSSPFLYLQGTDYVVQNIHVLEINVQEEYAKHDHLQANQ